MISFDEKGMLPNIVLFLGFRKIIVQIVGTEDLTGLNFATKYLK